MCPPGADVGAAPTKRGQGMGRMADGRHGQTISVDRLAAGAPSFQLDIRRFRSCLQSRT